MKAKLIGKHPFMLRKGSFRAVFPARNSRSGGWTEPLSRVCGDCRRMPIFRGHGLPFTEPEIFRVFPVDERSRQGGKDAGEGVRGMTDLLWITSKKRGRRRNADPPG